MLNILFLPGLGSSSAAINGVKNTGLLNNFNIIGHDYAGHNRRANDGYSDKPLSQAADECVEAMAHAKEKYILAGHSMGNAVAMLILQQVPEKIVGLIALEGNLMIENCGLVSRNLVNAKNATELEKIKTDLITQFQNSPLPGWREWAKDLATMSTQILQDYARELFALSQSGDLLLQFQNFLGPKCYLYGDDYVGYTMVEKLSGIPAYHVPNSGHFLMQDQPEICTRYIREVCDSALAP